MQYKNVCKYIKKQVIKSITSEHNNIIKIFTFIVCLLNYFGNFLCKHVKINANLTILDSCRISIVH